MKIMSPVPGWSWRRNPNS